MEIVLILVVVLALVATVAGVGASRRRQRGLDLEPPPPTRPAPTRPKEAPRPPVESPEAQAPPEVVESPEVQAPPEVVESPEAVEAPFEVVESPPEPEPEVGPEPEVEVESPVDVELERAPAAVRPRFRDRLGKARTLFAAYVSSMLSRTAIDDETWEELEEALIRADVGVGLTASLLDEVRTKVKAEGVTTSEGLLEIVKQDLKQHLSEGDRSLKLHDGGPAVWLFVGVNGVGKTTTIGKLGLREAAAGRKVVMAAGDTFRAAAAEQLGMWAERVGADLVRGAEGGDPGSVVFDAVERAAARKADLVLADTAGRLHTKVNLMEELKKVRRIAERPPANLTEVLLVIDATTGQNGLVQAREFADAVDVTGVVLTKLDGTAKGGIALAIACEMGLPIKLVGLGEKAEDLIEFDPDEFVDALFA